MGMVKYKTQMVCSRCGSNKVQIKAWIDANTGEYCSDVDDGRTAWCDKCQKETTLREAIIGSGSSTNYKIIAKL